MAFYRNLIFQRTLLSQHLVTNVVCYEGLLSVKLQAIQALLFLEVAC